MRRIEKTELEGWTQFGNIHGEFYSSWAKPPFYYISQGDVTKKYWAKTPVSIIGSSTTLKGAAALVEKYISEN